MFFRPYTPKLEDIAVNETGLSETEREDDAITWFNQNQDSIRLKLSKPPGWQFDCNNVNAARDFYQQMARDLKGAMLELEVKKIKNLEALVGVFKYRAPIPKSMAMYYVGIVWLPFRDFGFQINFESLERGTTGMREAAVMMLEPTPTPPVQQESIAFDSMEDMFEHSRNQPLRRISSDDAKWDETFPDHPLSKVRRMLGRFEANAVFSPQLLKQPPYRAT